MKDRARTNFMGIFYLPNVTSIVTLCLAWKWIYDFRYGMLNYVLCSLGFENINWLASKYTALPSLILFLIYIGLGCPIILHTAAMSAIPKTFEEAAKIDGASQWQVLWNITIPLIRPTTLYLLILETIGSFQVFVIILLMTLGGPYYRTTTLAFQLTEEAFKFSHYGIASTYGIILLAVVGILTLIQYKFLSKDIEY
jgi:multiple sugar transport system permease protein